MWLTIDELSVYLKISKETIYKMAKANKLPCSKIGNQWRFNRQLVDDWLLGNINISTNFNEKIALNVRSEIK